MRSGNITQHTIYLRSFSVEGEGFVSLWNFSFFLSLSHTHIHRFNTNTVKRAMVHSRSIVLLSHALLSLTNLSLSLTLILLTCRISAARGRCPAIIFLPFFILIILFRFFSVPSLLILLWESKREKGVYGMARYIQTLGYTG